MKKEEDPIDEGYGLGWVRVYKRYGWKLFLAAIIISLIAIYFTFLI